MSDCKWVGSRQMDYIYVCDANKVKQTSKAKGSVLGMMVCALKCATITDSFQYSFKDDSCLCKSAVKKEPKIPLLWRYR